MDFNNLILQLTKFAGNWVVANSSNTIINYKIRKDGSCRPHIRKREKHHLKYSKQWKTPAHADWWGTKGTPTTWLRVRMGEGGRHNSAKRFHQHIRPRLKLIPISSFLIFVSYLIVHLLLVVSRSLTEAINRSVGKFTTEITLGPLFWEASWDPSDICFLHEMTDCHHQQRWRLHSKVKWRGPELGTIADSDKTGQSTLTPLTRKTWDNLYI